MPLSNADNLGIPREESLRRLRDFLRDLEKLLDDLAVNPQSIMPGSLHASMQAAWSEVRIKFDAAVTQLQAPSEANEFTQLQTKLDAVGLHGQQLVFKLRVYEYFRRKLEDHGTLEGAKGKKRSWFRRFLGLFKPALKAADVILGSLSKAFPANPFELIKEYKESVEAGVEAGSTLRG